MGLLCSSPGHTPLTSIFSLSWYRERFQSENSKYSVALCIQYREPLTPPVDVTPLRKFTGLLSKRSSNLSSLLDVSYIW